MLFFLIFHDFWCIWVSPTSAINLKNLKQMVRLRVRLHFYTKRVFNELRMSCISSNKRKIFSIFYIKLLIQKSSFVFYIN